MFSAKDSGVDRPGARPDQGKAGAQSRDQEGNHGIKCAGDERQDQEGGDGCSDHRSPQADRQQSAGTDGDEHRQEHGMSVGAAEMQDGEVDQDAAGDQPLQQESDPGQAVGECGEKALHRTPRPTVRDLRGGGNI